MRRVVVVGAGLAGARVCEELRAQGYDGSITLAGAEPHLPYDRPPLSKALLAGRTDDTTLDVPWEDLDVDVWLGAVATHLAPGDLATTRGSLGYDTLVLATGAQPVRLAGDEGSHVLRTVDDARRLRTALLPGARVVVVGAGWLGGEVASVAVSAGCAVTVVEVAPTPAAAALGAAVGSRLQRWYVRAGIDLRLSTSVAAVAAAGVTLATGERVAGDVVLTAVGVRPDTAWLAGTGLELADGIVTDGAGRTSLPGVFAVGDCARRWSPRAGRLVRTEHWDDALHAPAATVTAILGGSAGYDPVPYFWSEQFGHWVQFTGWRTGDPTLWRGDPDSDTGWAAAWLDAAGRLRGFLAVDRQRDLIQARRVIEAGGRPDPDRLARPDVPVRAA